ncbi:hypothetical protein THAOC_34964, partial [Thalassiosira oceanica]
GGAVDPRLVALLRALKALGLAHPRAARFDSAGGRLRPARPVPGRRRGRLWGPSGVRRRRRHVAAPRLAVGGRLGPAPGRRRSPGGFEGAVPGRGGRRRPGDGRAEVRPVPRPVRRRGYGRPAPERRGRRPGAEGGREAHAGGTREQGRRRREPPGEAGGGRVGGKPPQVGRAPVPAGGGQDPGGVGRLVPRLWGQRRRSRQRRQRRPAGGGRRSRRPRAEAGEVQRLRIVTIVAGPAREQDEARAAGGGMRLGAFATEDVAGGDVYVSLPPGSVMEDPDLA